MELLSTAIEENDLEKIFLEESSIGFQNLKLQFEVYVKKILLNLKHIHLNHKSPEARFNLISIRKLS